jgi:hypothetical protein
VPAKLAPAGAGGAGVHAKELGVAPTDYEKHIRTEELLALQKPAEAPRRHDELQFQVVHQAHELYSAWTDAQAAKGHDPGYHG